MNNSAMYRQDRGFWQVLPVAVLGWLLALWGVGSFLSTPTAPEEKPEVIEAKIVELPPEVQAANRQPAAAAPRQAPVPPPPQLTQPTPPPPAQAESKPAPAAPPPAAVPVAAAKPVYGVETYGPNIRVRPPPVLPDELMDQMAGQSITVRLSVSADGSINADIPERSVDPRIRRSIVEQIKKTWRADAAVQAGKPVSSTQDVTFDF
jgi:hypothetical protein